MAFLTTVIVRTLQSYWRLTRGLTLVAEACILDAGNQVALARTPDGNGWSLPGNSVRRGEALEDALCRALRDGYGVELEGHPELCWIYLEPRPAPETQAGLFVVRRWKAVSPAAASLNFFDTAALPTDIDPRIAARIRQALEGSQPFEVC